MYDSIALKGEKYFEKFDKNQFEIRSMRFDSTSSLVNVSQTDSSQRLFYLLCFYHYDIRKIESFFTKINEIQDEITTKIYKIKIPWE